ncbi:M23 family metallopeptidase [Salipaludibacillus daqingensis]|uniref:M23 family metallopeptidase n=1 Tax=Salipaludibacillus daqingensis TaxID=3041001 RepID=UPI002473006E|nr:M23 family metallopeptidase [Salipaludibacillus daqingensis]
MADKLSKLKKEMAAKRRTRNIQKNPVKSKARVRSNDYPMWTMKHDEEREETFYSFDPSKDFSGSKQKSETFFRKDAFMMQVLASICLFLSIGILLQTTTPVLEEPRNLIRSSFQTEFEFDRVALWYEDLFGRPLALMPVDMESVAPGDMDENITDEYALPATGKVRETFHENGTGIFVETEANESVGAVKSGIVRFIGEVEQNDLGKVVVVRHYDGGESWYGMLDDIKVNLYDHVDEGELLAKVSSNDENSTVGIYYFALKEGDSFVDPIEVISVD